MVVFGKSGCIPAKVVVIEKKWLFSGKVHVFGKVVVIGHSGCFRANMVVLGQKWLYSGKVVVFRQKWLYLVKSCLSPTKFCIRAKVFVLW